MFADEDSGPQQRKGNRSAVYANQILEVSDNEPARAFPRRRARHQRIAKRAIARRLDSAWVRQRPRIEVKTNRAAYVRPQNSQVARVVSRRIAASVTGALLPKRQSPRPQRQQLVFQHACRIEADLDRVNPVASSFIRASAVIL